MRVRAEFFEVIFFIILAFLGKGRREDGLCSPDRWSGARATGPGYRGAAVLLRMTNSAANLFVPTDSPARRAVMDSIAEMPRRYLGWLTVVRGTWKCSAVRVLPKPTTEMFSGIFTP